MRFDQVDPDAASAGGKRNAKLEQRIDKPTYKFPAPPVEAEPVAGKPPKPKRSRNRE